MGERIIRMVIKEFIQVFRDPRMKAVIFVVPVIQLLVFGYAVSTDVRHVPTAVYDAGNSAIGRDLAARFGSSDYFDITDYPRSHAEAARLIDSGDVRVALIMDGGFEEDLRAGRTALLQIIIDGTDSNTAGIVLGYGAGVTADFSKEIMAERLGRSRGMTVGQEAVELRTRAWFNENLESRNYYIPGVIAMMVMLITLMLTSMAVVREKEIGTMEQIMVTPITPLEFILGKTIPFGIIGFADVIIITVVGVFWFEVPIRGSLLLLFFATALYLMTALGVGLFISTVSRTQQQAMMSTFFFFFPAVLLSGFMFPIANMPEPVQWLTYINPLRYFLVIVRGIFLKGIGADILWPQMAVLAVMGTTVLWVASRRITKTSS